jgi:hypothetical protein
MRRRLFNILSAASLLLFVATCALSARSYWNADDINHADADDLAAIRFNSGFIMLYRETADDGVPDWTPATLRHEVFPPELPDADPRWRWGDMQIDTSGSMGIYYRCLTIPSWMAVALMPATLCISRIAGYARGTMHP